MPELQEHILAKDNNVDPLRLLFPSGNKKPRIVRGFLNNGAHGRIRTSDRLVRSQVLYPAELHAHLVVGRYYATRL